MKENKDSPLRYLNKLQLNAELDRCLNCKRAPCMTACPVNCNPRDFIAFAKTGRWQESVNTITLNNPMAETCGLICPDKFCMKACVRGHVDFAVNIPRVQATILANYREKPSSSVASEPQTDGKRVAIIGAGPAGIAAAAMLARAGIRVDIFESRHEIGGALNMIPDARLPHDVIERDWAFIERHDRIALHLNRRVEDPRALCAAYDGVIVATGEPNCLSLNIGGEELSVSYMDYLYEPEKYQTSGSVAIIGGGNVAADCALTAKRLGAGNVEMFIRRRISDMRVSKAEYLELIAAQINLFGMTSPTAIARTPGSDALLTLEIRRNIYRDDRWQPLENSSTKLPYFTHIIRAIGSRADEKPENCPANLIYAGDCKTGGSTIVEAIASGRQAAEQFIEQGG